MGGQAVIRDSRFTRRVGPKLGNLVEDYRIK